MTIRCKLPILLSELIAEGVVIHFGYHIKEPVLEWSKGEMSGHFHLDWFQPGVHGGNAILIQKHLEEILAEVRK